MYSDRELLALAAKAAGLQLCGYSWIGESEGDDECEVLESAFVKLHPEQELASKWNPLTDDGDALRLAVKMGLTIDCDGRGITARKSFGGAQIVLSAESEYGPPDVNARMRRCIVRAAAAHIERGYQ